MCPAVDVMMRLIICAGCLLVFKSQSTYSQTDLIDGTRQATQSGTQGGHQARNAIDGDLFSYSLADTSQLDYTGDRTFAWWQVDLGNNYTVTSVAITSPRPDAILGGVAEESLQYLTYEAGHAIDGNLATYAVSINIDNSFAWWQLELNETFTITGMNLSGPWENVGCVYGDKATWCSTYVPANGYGVCHNGDTNVETNCCQSCSTFSAPIGISASKQTITPTCSDTPSWCNTTTPDQCYIGQTATSCCVTCANFTKFDPNYTYLANFTVWVGPTSSTDESSGQLCHHYSGTEITREQYPYQITCDQPVTGRYVTIKRRGGSYPNKMTLSEVTISGSKPDQLLQNFVVWVGSSSSTDGSSAQICYDQESNYISPGVKSTMTCTQATTGRYVTIKRQGGPLPTTLALAEVNVFGYLASIPTSTKTANPSTSTNPRTTVVPTTTQLVPTQTRPVQLVSTVLSSITTSSFISPASASVSSPSPVQSSTGILEGTSSSNNITSDSKCSCCPTSVPTPMLNSYIIIIIVLGSVLVLSILAHVLIIVCCVRKVRQLLSVIKSQANSGRYEPTGSNTPADDMYALPFEQIKEYNSIKTYYRPYSTRFRPEAYFDSFTPEGKRKSVHRFSNYYNSAEFNDPSYFELAPRTENPPTPGVPVLPGHKPQSRQLGPRVANKTNNLPIPEEPDISERTAPGIPKRSDPAYDKKYVELMQK